MQLQMLDALLMFRLLKAAVLESWTFCYLSFEQKPFQVQLLSMFLQHLQLHGQLCQPPELSTHFYGWIESG
jgi:hypothetical protein